tara:strand:- start:278 stop:697 length:420 start_codon:yes stop_codon:yes gene_type:complete
MGDEFYAIIKLVSGEEIFAMVCVDDSDDEPILLLHHPIKMNIIQTPKGGFIKVHPWIELTSEDMYVLRMDKVITMTESHDKKLIDVYKRYIEDTNDDDSMDIYKASGKVKITDQMGYISSVQEARESLEKIFNNNPKES